MREKINIILVALALTAAATIGTGVVLAQWGPQGGHLNFGGGTFSVNCPASTCSQTGQVLNLPGLSAKSQLTADSASSASTTLVNTGISFPIAAKETGTLNCAVYFTNGSGGGLELAVNGPGTPTQVTTGAQIATAAAVINPFATQGATWAAVNGSTTSTVTTLQVAEFSAAIENGTSAGTLALQFADVNATGNTVVKRGSWCSFP